MSSCSRRIVLAGLASAGLSACGFTPAYGPAGGAGRLQGQVGVNAPATRAGFLILQRLEERLGRGDGGPLVLNVRVETDESFVGVTEGDETTRVQLFGTADWTLQRAGDGPGTRVATGKSQNFTGYSTTGSTVATQAAARDALERLMTILADQIVEELLIDADTILP